MNKTTGYFRDQFPKMAEDLRKQDANTREQSNETRGVWDERTKTWIRPSGTVKQGRRPMFKPFKNDASNLNN